MIGVSTADLRSQGLGRIIRSLRRIAVLSALPIFFSCGLLFSNTAGRAMIFR